MGITALRYYCQGSKYHARPCREQRGQSGVYLLGLSLLSYALCLLVLPGPLGQVGVVGQTVEERRYLRPSVHLLLQEGEQREKIGRDEDMTRHS